MRLKTAIIFVLAAIFCIETNAEKIEYTGVVLDRQSKIVPGASIVTKDGQTVVSDFDGMFRLVSETPIKEVTLKYLKQQKKKIKLDPEAFNILVLPKDIKRLKEEKIKKDKKDTSVRYSEMSGIVVDKKCHPLPEATLTSKKTSATTEADAKGFFNLHTPEDDTKAVVQAQIGKKTKKTTVKMEPEKFNIAMVGGKFNGFGYPATWRYFATANLGYFGYGKEYATGKIPARKCFPFGIMVGAAKKAGIYARLNFIPHGKADAEYYSDYEYNYEDNNPSGNLLLTPDGDYYNKGPETGLTQFSAGIIIKYRRSPHYFYVGLGGTNRNSYVKSYYGKTVKDRSNSGWGLNLDFGEMLTFGHIAINYGFILNSDLGIDYGIGTWIQSNIGVGYIF